MFHKTKEIKNKIEINNQEFNVLKKNALIIDVRDEGEYDILKKLPDTINIPYLTLLANPEKYIPTKDTVVITVCNAGNRSSHSAYELRNRGYKNTYVLITGIYGYFR